MQRKYQTNKQIKKQDNTEDLINKLETAIIWQKNQINGKEECLEMITYKGNIYIYVL